MRLLPGILAMTAIVVASNILVQFLILDGILTWGAFTYPFAFLVTEIMNRLYGTAAARRVVLVGFVIGIICSIIGTQVMLEFGPAVTLRVAVASASGFLVAQLLDIAVFNGLRQRVWWQAPFFASIAGTVVDTALFFTIGFSATVGVVFPAWANEQSAWAQDLAAFMTVGPQMPLWVSLAVADLGVKLAIACFALIPFRLIIGRILGARTV